MPPANAPTDGHTRRFTFRIFRYAPETEAGPRFDTFALDVPPGTTVLAALLRIQRELDGSLAFRFSCRGAACGACAVTINGRCGLACRTQLFSLPAGEVILEPLPHLEVIRDLIVDLAPFWEKYRRVRPWLHPAPAVAPLRGRDVAPVSNRGDHRLSAGATDPRLETGATENRQSPREFGRIEPYINCILCACCYGACPALRRQPEYLGPAALAKLCRFIDDSRDHRGPEALAAMDSEEQGAWGCDMLFRCIEACPKDVRPADAVATLRRRMIGQRLTQEGSGTFNLLSLFSGRKRGQALSTSHPSSPATNARECLTPSPPPFSVDGSLFNRRDLLTGLMGAGVVGIGAVAGQTVLGYLTGIKVPEPEQVIVSGAALEQLARERFVLVAYGPQPVMIYRPADGRLRAVTAVCTHSQCNVHYRPGTDDIYCGCHHGRFTAEGVNVPGTPPPRPLRKFCVRPLDNGTLLVSAEPREPAGQAPPSSGPATG